MTAASAPPPYVFGDGVVRTAVDVRTYRLSAIKKVGYRLADRCTIALGELADTSLPITFMFPPKTDEAGAMAAVRMFFQELLDQELREQLAEESQPIRALILAHAFSRTDLVRRR